MIYSGLDFNLARSAPGIANPIASLADEHWQTCVCAGEVAHLPPGVDAVKRALDERLKS
jgi:hypothetical protein